MSTPLEDFLNSHVKPLFDSFFDAHAKDFNLTTNDGCGQYTEAAVASVQLTFPKVGHLKKNPGQTQYNGHANDAFLYREGDPSLYRAVDIIGAAESTDPNNPPKKNFGIDIPRYTDEYWLAKPASGGGTAPVNMVPWVPYYGDQSNAEFKRILAYDYGRRPQGADFDVSVWAFRVVYTAGFGLASPADGGKPLGLSASVEHHRPEWCAALGVPVVPLPAGWNIGDPV